MIDVLTDIIESVRASGPLDVMELGQLLNEHNRRAGGKMRAFSKKRLLPYYLKLKENEPEVWKSLDIDEELERDLFATLRMKPRRTASGVATITVITKPHPCSGSCLYCPNDVRMPKSYLHREPACQRAERNYFDPYLQVSSRLRALTQMGHTCDKIELIVLGGSWTDYPVEYQTWFMKELFRALNENGGAPEDIKARREQYQTFGIDGRDKIIDEETSFIQTRVNSGELTYNQAVRELYGPDTKWGQAASWQTAHIEELGVQHKANETADHRVVGLVVETRPEALDASTLARLREFGCTKVQIGVQTLRPEILKMNQRPDNTSELISAFELLRIFGFKLHTHFMMNLYGSTIEDDKGDYERFMTDNAFMPDEVKLYPCVLVDGTGLVEKYEGRSWKPYSEDELVEALASDMLVTPPFTRVSRMIRDISAEDIMAGSKKTNLRQLVESTEAFSSANVQEIRSREIAGDDVKVQELVLEDLPYETSNTTEHFLQWVTPENKIAGFLRLSLPRTSYVKEYAELLPEELGCAMIREVHVYGQVANLHKADGSAQHLGLGRKLIERACEIARNAGFDRINVISSVGTREYYRKLGFEDGSLYQSKWI